MPTPEREKLIRSVWENIARPRWQREQLEFRLFSSSTSGHPLPAIVCDGVIVEEWRPIAPAGS
jgi:hypothetical protein